jgi:hypothetical protein
LKRETEKYPASKVPRQWPLVVIVKIYSREGKELGSEKGKSLGSGLRYEHREEFILPT